MGPEAEVMKHCNYFSGGLLCSWVSSADAKPKEILMKWCKSNGLNYEDVLYTEYMELQRMRFIIEKLGEVV